jgi:hypothetical protein
MSRGGIHLVQAPGLNRIEPATTQQVGHADNAVHRRANLVAHVGKESALGAIRRVRRVPCGRQFGGAQSHLVFKPVAMQPQLVFAQRQVGRNPPGFVHLGQVAPARHQRGRRRHHDDRREKDKIGRKVVKIRWPHHMQGIARKKREEYGFGKHGQQDRLPGSQQPAGDHQDQRIVDQVRAAQPAVDRRHGGGGQPIAPYHQHAGRMGSTVVQHDIGHATDESDRHMHLHAQGVDAVVGTEQGGQEEAGRGKDHCGDAQEARRRGIVTVVVSRRRSQFNCRQGGREEF